ncbi:MAG: hypothetical protein HN356_12245 [Calditrichaeota bacterium]|nr:hypothetical protein [Calditrichota bacterium]
MKLDLMWIVLPAISVALGVTAFTLGIRTLVLIKRSSKDGGAAYSGKAIAWISLIVSALLILFGAIAILMVIVVHSIENAFSENTLVSPAVQGTVNEYFYSDPEFNLGPLSTVVLPDSSCLTLVRVENRKDNPKEYSNDYILLKTNFEGEELLRLKLDHQACAMAYLPEHGVFIAGSKEVKFSPKQLWRYSIDCELVDSYPIEGFQQNRVLGSNLIATSDGNLFLTGSLFIESTENKENADKFLSAIKISPEGKTIWQENLPASEIEYGNMSVEANDGGFLIPRSIKIRNQDPKVAGWISSIYLRLTKFSQAGTLEWEKNISDSLRFEAFEMVLSTDESIVLLGNDFSSDSTEGLSGVSEFDKNGNFQFSQVCEPIIRNLGSMDPDAVIPYYPELTGINPWQNGNWLVCGRLLKTDIFKSHASPRAKNIRWFISTLDENMKRINYFFGAENTVAPLFATRISPGHAVVTCVGDRKEVADLRAESETRFGGSVVLLHYFDE